MAALCNDIKSVLNDPVHSLKARSNIEADAWVIAPPGSYLVRFDGSY